MLTLISGGETEPLDQEAVDILNRVHYMIHDDIFWANFQKVDYNSTLVRGFIEHVRRNRNKEPDFAEGENEPTDVCSPPTRAGS